MGIILLSRNREGRSKKAKAAYYGLGGSVEEEVDRSNDGSDDGGDDDAEIGDMEPEKRFPARQCPSALVAVDGTWVW